ncbi:MAG: chloride channel protein [Elusimicrobia bacterium]|nr:chloride channel protein [Elusimicrobiota bacterium]
MVKRLFGYYNLLSKHRYGVTFAAYIASAFVTGVACVAFMRAFAFADGHRLDFSSVGWWCLLTTPLLFTLAVFLVRRLAPYAAGSGIPQAIYVVRHGGGRELHPIAAAMMSPVTLLVKVVSILLGVWAGASVGREGPTVQIGVCTLFMCMALLSRFLPVKPDPRSIALAGGSAGLAAAFNTPLAGVTFALEELSGGYFESFKDYVIMAIIVAALSAKVITGEYVYFGKLPNPQQLGVAAIVIIGVAGGLAGRLFSLGIMRGVRAIDWFASKGLRWLFPAACGLALLGLAFVGGAYVQGPGNRAAQDYLTAHYAGVPSAFPFAKLLGTVATYWSGVAGGLFAPSLSIGSGLGAELAKLLDFPVASCALVGMSAFLSAAILAPMTAFVIIFELTGHHSMLLPIMLAALIGYITAKALGARSLYGAMADRYPVPENTAPASPAFEASSRSGSAG